MSENQTTKPLLKKVLIVDDSSIDLLVAQMSIKKYAFAEEVITKQSARSGLDYLSSLESTPENLPQLIFLDINMPELSGFDFLDEFEKLPEVIHRYCDIMMLSTSLVEEDHIKATSNRFVCKFLNKPLDRIKIDNVRTELKNGQIEKLKLKLPD